MSVTKQFNGLHGTTVTRETLIELQAKAKAENHTEVYERVSKFLANYPDDKKFEIEIDTPARETGGLSVPVVPKKKGEELHYMQDNVKVASINKHGVITWHKKGIPSKERYQIRKAARVVGLGCPNPVDFNGMLHGIDMETENHEQIYGLGKAVSANEIFDMVNNLMLNTIKEVGHLPWQKEWHGSGDEMAMNYVTKKPYTGINALMLNFNTAIKGGKLVLVPAEFEQPYYLTFAQIEAAGAKLKKGSKGREVIYYNFVLNYKDGDLNFNGTDKKKFGEFATKNKLTAAQIESNLKRVPLLKYYHVYKADDCEGLKPHAKAVKKVNPIEAAQEIIDGYPNHPKYIFGTDKAFYKPSDDSVSMPKINAFTNEADYYSTFFHEITHSTGAPHRLDRDFSGRFGNASYAYEELIAELGAVYLCAESGILFHTRENSAKYLRSWNKKLVQNMENDNRFFMRAAAQAQKAADFILDKDNKKAVPKPKGQKKTKKTVKKPTPKPNAIEKPAVKPIAKVQKKTKKAEIIGYAIVDNIDGSIVASKKTLQELEAVYQNLDVFIEDLPVLVYEIIRKNDKNVLGDKVDVNWSKAKKKAEPKGFANKPKSASIKAAIQDVLTLPKFKKEKELPASIVYKHFSEAKDDEAEHQGEFSEFEDNILENSSTLLYDYEFDYITPLGVEFVTAVNGRLESLRNQKHNLALFDGLKSPAIPEIETIYQEVPAQVPAIPVRDMRVPLLEAEEPVHEQEVNLPLNRNSLAYRKQQNANIKHEYYTIENPDIATFLGKIEKKKKESVAITIAGGQGSGKTSFVFQLINEFAKRYRVGHASIEEHPESALYENKAERFWNENAKATVDSPEINSLEDIHDLIMRNDVIIIDSFSKLLSMNNRITLDDTFRKKYDGKLFVIIYQLTTDGKMRGGSSSQFDGDIILFVEKFPDFNDNYVYADKNRYQNRSLDELHYNIATAKLVQPEEEEEDLRFEEVERI